MCLFLSPHGITIFLSSIIRLLFQLGKRVAHSSLGSCLVSPVRVDSPELGKVICYTCPEPSNMTVRIFNRACKR
jgi:hypothetical protein